MGEGTSPESMPERASPILRDMPELRSAMRRLLGRPAADDARPKRRYLEDAKEGIARVRAAGHDRPILLVMWMYDCENPFQALLTAAAGEPADSVVAEWMEEMIATAPVSPMPSAVQLLAGLAMCAALVGVAAAGRP